MNKHSLRPITVTLVMSLTLVACKQDDAENTSTTDKIPEVGILTVQSRPLTLSTELPGRTTPYRIAEIRPQVGGILLNRLFEEGSEVKAGQPLYQIDPASYRATLTSTEASLESAHLLSQRYDRLIQKHAISQQDRDDARSQFLQAKAAVEGAQINLGYTRITSPIDGRIGRSSVTQGALLTANQETAMATVQQLDPIYVDLTQSSTEILRLKEDFANGRLKTVGEDQAEIRLLLENGKPYQHTGKLQFGEVNVDQGTGAVTLRAVFPNPENLLMPGMFVRAQLQQGIRSNALLVPQRGITRDKTGQALALVVGPDRKVQQRKITVERSVDTQWLVSNGLQVGDQLIVDGTQNVHPGIEVKPVPATDDTVQTNTSNPPSSK